MNLQRVPEVHGGAAQQLLDGSGFLLADQNSQVVAIVVADAPTTLLRGLDCFATVLYIRSVIVLAQDVGQVVDHLGNTRMLHVHVTCVLHVTFCAL